MGTVTKFVDSGTACSKTTAPIAPGETVLSMASMELISKRTCLPIHLPSDVGELRHRRFLEACQWMVLADHDVTRSAVSDLDELRGFRTLGRGLGLKFASPEHAQHVADGFVVAGRQPWVPENAQRGAMRIAPSSRTLSPLK